MTASPKMYSINTGKVFLITLIVLFEHSVLLRAQVKGYNYAESVKHSPYFRVYAANKDIFVYDNPVAAIAAFDISGTNEIIVKANIDLKWVDIRPKNMAIKYSFKDSTITIELSGPCKFSVELNGRINNPLLVFANSWPANELAENNKNTIIFKAGKEYNAGEIALKSNQRLYIAGGAVVHGWITANHTDHITIAGNGILDGSHNQDAGQYHRGINLLNSKNINLSGIVMSNGTTWELVPENCDSVKINNVKIISHGDSDDGIDVVSSRDVLINDCFIRTKDDCIAIKANSDQVENGIVKNIMVKNCTIWNGPWGNGFEIGFELEASEISNIIFQDCDIIHIENGAAMSIHNAGRSNVHRIFYYNIRIEDSRVKLFDFAVFVSAYSVDGPKTDTEKNAKYLNGAWDGVTYIAPGEKQTHAKYRGRINDISIKDVKVVEGPFPYSIFYGYDEQHQVSNITINNLSVYGQKIIDLKTAKIYMEQAREIKIN